MYFCLCVYVRASSALFSVTFVVRVVLSEKEKKKTFSRTKIYIILSFVFIVVVAVVVTFVSPQSLSFSLLDAGKRALCLLFEGGGGHHHDDQNSRRSEAERDFECFVWFSLSTSIQNSGAKTYTYSFVLEKGPLDTHHGASFLGPRTVDAV